MIPCRTLPARPVPFRSPVRQVSKLDNEMAGGLPPTAETVPVQLLVFRSSLGNDTVGLKGV